MKRRHALRLILLLITAYLAYVPFQPSLARRARLATERRLNQTIIPTLDSNGSPLHAVLAQLESAIGVPVETRWQTLEPIGVTSDKPVHARLRNIPADKAFLILLDTLHSQGAVASWIDEGGGRIIVGDLADSPSRHPSWEVYDLSLFFQGVPQDPQHPRRVKATQALKSLFTDTIDPPSWRERGGSVGQCWIYGDRMLVLQAEENHRDLATLLIQLKETELQRLYHRLRGWPWPPPKR